MSASTELRLAGRFQSTPPPVAPQASQADRDLTVLASVQEAGLVFFSLTRPAEPPRIGGALSAYGGTLITEIDCNWKVVVEHLLTGRPLHADDFIWRGPLLAVRRAGAKAIVEQIVPHTFLRTRLFTHVFGDTAEAHRQPAGVSKHICERLQADRAAGTMPNDDSPLLTNFHRGIEQVYAGSS